jgi:hypothetical protein
VMLLMLPETRGRSLASLEPALNPITDARSG